MKTHPVKLISILACSAALWSGAAYAQTTVRDTWTGDTRVVTAPKLKSGDRNFLEKAARAGMEEVEISRVAAARSSNPDVRRLAQAIISDHESANEELMSLAAAKGVSLPAKELHGSKWEKRDAGDFDRDYLDKMVSAHNDAVKLFEKQAKDGEDPETVAFARKHLPKLQKHQQQAIDLKRLLK